MKRYFVSAAICLLITNHAAEIERPLAMAAIISAVASETFSEDNSDRSESQYLQTVVQQDPSSAEAAADVLERSVSLSAREMSIREVVASIGGQAGIFSELDEESIKAAGIDLGAPVTITFDDESLREAMARVIQLMNGRRFTGAFWEIREDRLVITTLAARKERINAERQRTRELLPDWLKPHYDRGVLAEVNDQGHVISISAGDAMTDDLLAHIKTLPELRELHIENTTSLTSDDLAHLGEQTALEKLTLSSVNRDGAGLGDAAIRAVSGLESLQELSISECGTTDAGARLLELMPQLERLQLHQEGRLTDAALESIGRIGGLKQLDLTSYVGTQQYGWMRFSSAGTRHLSALKELEELHLIGHAVPAEALASDRLTSLSLGGPGVDDACAARIATCRKLRSLSLSYTGFTDQGMKQLATLPLLNRMDLDSHVVTDDGIAHLKGLKNLRHLRLRVSQVTDQSLAHLAEMNTLTQLDLHGSGHPGSVFGERFTVEGLIQLKALPKLRVLRIMNLQSPGGYLGLKELTQLRLLSLDMCDIKPMEVGALEETLPNTRISASSGGGLIRPPGSGVNDSSF